jgi:hypothetical protein
MNAHSSLMDSLRQLATAHPEIKTELRCCYSDGAGLDMYKLTFYHRHEMTYRGSLLLQLYYNRITFCKHQFQEGLEPDSEIIDILLDLINLQKSKGPSSEPDFLS